MRVSLLFVGGLHVVNVLVLASIVDASVSGRTFVPVYLSSFLTGLAALVLAFLIPWRRALAGTVSALALSLALGIGSVDPAYVFGFLFWASFTVPLAVVLLERSPSRPALMAVLAAAALLALTIPALVIDRYDVLWPSYSPAAMIMVPLMLGAEGAFGLALAWAGLASPRPAPGPAPSSGPNGPTPMRHGARIALSLGVALLAISWLLGGVLLLVPVWPLALGLLVGAALAQMRHATGLAVATLVLALVGFAPAGSCATHSYSDTGVEAFSEDRVSLMQMGGNGPRWSRGDGFGGTSYDCQGPTVALGSAWALGLVGLATASLLVGIRNERAARSAPT